MVVFQYGSAVLFNVEDPEVESYLDIVRRHASGLLSEMRKDGKFLSEFFSFLGCGGNDCILNTSQSLCLIGKVLNLVLLTAGRCSEKFIDTIIPSVRTTGNVNNILERRYSLGKVATCKFCLMNCNIILK